MGWARWINTTSFSLWVGFSQIERNHRFSLSHAHMVLPLSLFSSPFCFADSLFLRAIGTIFFSQSNLISAYSYFPALIKCLVWIRFFFTNNFGLQFAIAFRLIDWLEIHSFLVTIWIWCCLWCVFWFVLRSNFFILDAMKWGELWYELCKRKKYRICDFFVPQNSAVWIVSWSWLRWYGHMKKERHNF